jgi:hypothetical protein
MGNPEVVGKIIAQFASDYKLNVRTEYNKNLNGTMFYIHIPDTQKITSFLALHDEQDDLNYLFNIRHKLYDTLVERWEETNE